MREQDRADAAGPVVGLAELIAAQQYVRTVHMDRVIVAYASSLVAVTRAPERELPDALTQLRQPFFLNAAAQAAALEALAHQDEVARRVERTAVARVHVVEGLRDLGIEAAEGHANFCWFDLGAGRDEAEIVDGLAQQGVLVRAGAALGKDGALRVSFGTPSENDRFLAALATLL